MISPGICFLDYLTLGSHELLRLGKLDFAAALDVVDFHAGCKLAGAYAHESDSVAVSLVHVGLYFENESREILGEWVDETLGGLTQGVVR